MKLLKEKFVEIIYSEEIIETHYMNYISNEALETLSRIRMILDDDNMSEFKCILAIIRNLDYLESGL